jgi:hypothetical protein
MLMWNSQIDESRDKGYEKWNKSEKKNENNRVWNLSKVENEIDK